MPLSASASTRRVQKKNNSAYQMAMISKSREDHGDRMTTKERRAAEDKERRDDEAGAGVHSLHHTLTPQLVSDSSPTTDAMQCNA